MLKIISILMVSTAVLSGCYLERDINYVRPEQSLVNVKKIHQIIDYKSKHRITLTTEEIANLHDKIIQAQKIQDVHVTIFAPFNARREKNSRIQTRVNHIAHVLHNFGLPKSSIQVLGKLHWNHEDTKWKEDMMVIQVEWYDRHVKCPGWDQIMDSRVSPEGEENFGCTNQSNLAKMVDDPKDLLSGKDLKNLDSQNAVNSIERYHTDKTKQVKVEKMDITSSS